MSKIKIINVVGARPNFVKMAPLLKEMKKHPDKIDCLLVHTGQHYDKAMSESFFEELKIQTPDINLGIGSGSHAQQTAKIMIEFEKVCLKENPDLVLVVGDVNSTIACTLVAKKLGIKVAHVEAGLRSFDEEMPEEINRILTDRISDYLFVSEKSGLTNLKNEGFSDNKVFFVGNIMIDSLVQNLKRKTDICEKNNYSNYCLVTLHRPSNVDNKERLEELLDILQALPEKIVWPIHPRTKNNIENFGLQKKLDGFILLGPQGYLDFITLLSNCKFALTDSGGIQEETTFLKIPCITIRKNTERPSTIIQGTNILVDTAKEIRDATSNISRKNSTIPQFWDGETSKRIVDCLLSKSI